MVNVQDSFASLRAPAKLLEPVTDPAEWRGADMARNKVWLHELAPAEIAEIDAAVKVASERDFLSVGRADFALPEFAATLAEMRQEILYGRGFVLIRGLPIDHYDQRQAAMAFWGIGRHLGDDALSQNAKGHVLGHVADIGQSRSDPNQRGPYSSEMIPYHVDCCDIVGLLCLQTSASGGESSLASSVAVYNELLRRRPDLVRVLAAPYYRDRRGEIPPGMDPWYSLPVFNTHEGYFSASLEPTYMGSAHRFPEVPEMTPAQTEALETVQALADELRLDMEFRRGDMQFINNHVIFHTRQAFRDDAAAGKKRHLLRLWLKNLDGRPLPAPYYARHGTVETVDRPGGIVGPDTVLNTPLDPE